MKSVPAEEKDEEYRPYDTLRAIGFSKDEAKGFIQQIETAADTQLPEEPKKAPDVTIRFKERKAALRRSRLKNLLLIIWGYAFVLWLYVITIQLIHPQWIYAQFATWLHIRTDYVGEAALVASLIMITAITMWNTNRSSRPIRREDQPPQTPLP